MMMVRSRFTFFGLSTLVMAIVYLMIQSTTHAATSAEVSATVTAQNVSVTLTTDGAVDYGTQSISTTTDTTDDGIDDTETVQNNGNVAQDFDIKGANTASWTLGSTGGANQYAHKFCTTTCDTSPTWTALTTSDQALATSVAASGSQSFDLQLIMPTSTASYVEQTLAVTVTASAS